MKKYSHVINYFRKVDGQGWQFETCKATNDSVWTTMKSLIHRQQAGQVRSIQMVKLK